MLYPVLIYPSSNGGMFSLIRFRAAISKIAKAPIVWRALWSPKALKAPGIFASRRLVRYASMEQASVDHSPAS
jgi:hypothetical protein